jgi:hypothetical protein
MGSLEPQGAWISHSGAPVIRVALTAKLCTGQLALLWLVVTLAAAFDQRHRVHVASIATDADSFGAPGAAAAAADALAQHGADGPWWGSADPLYHTWKSMNLAGNALLPRDSTAHKKLAGHFGSNAKVWTLEGGRCGSRLPPALEGGGGAAGTARLHL